MISVVVPVYKCTKYLEELTQRLEKVLKKITDEYEIIYVVDGNPENEWELVTKLSQQYKFVKGILLSRNFGQHPAIFTGLKYAKGDWIVVMDCDLQDLPEEIEKLYRKALEGYDVVLARRYRRQDNFIKVLFSKLFYKVLGYLTETEQDPTVANFGIYHRKVIDAVLSMNDYIKFFPAMVKWVGFNLTKLNVKHSPRLYDKSSYNFFKLIRLAVNVILTFSDKPLRLVVYFGAFLIVLSLFLALFYLYKYLSGQIVILGYASLIISIWFLAGVNFIILGMIGIYLGKTFNQTKGRPVAIVKEKINFENGKTK